MNRFTIGTALTLALLTAGCETRLNALTNPPPDHVGEYIEADGEVRLSPGVALAIECIHVDEPCEGLVTEVEDGTIAAARIAFVDDLTYSADARSDVPVSAFVVYAKRPGTTVLRLRGDGVSEALNIVVE